MNPGGQGCVFPGAEAYSAIQRLRASREQLRTTIWSDVDPGFDYNGWLGVMNVDHLYSSAWYLDKLMPSV
jgi:hypothetical protein